jgi:hypothetical protein
VATDPRSIPFGGDSVRSFLVGIALAGAVIACNSATDVGVAALVSLNRHQAQWAQRSFSSYSFDLVQQKFGGTANVHITVNGTTIVSVIDNTTGEPPVVDAGYPTIDELFATAQAVFGQKGETLQMEFNEQYGYPTLVAIDNSNPAGPYSAQVSNLAPTE